MAEGSNNLPVTTFIGLGTIIGLFVVFNSWRDTPTPAATDAPDSRGERKSQPARLTSEDGSTKAKEAFSSSSGQLWEQIAPGVYCLDAGCNAQRVTPGALAPCDSDACLQEHQGMICIQDDCRTYEEVQRSVDYLPATRRLNRRIREAVIYQGEQVFEPVVLELMLDEKGHVSRSSVVQSSGNQGYDRSVRQAAQAASPFSELLGIQPHTRSLLQLIHVRIAP